MPISRSKSSSVMPVNHSKDKNGSHRCHSRLTFRTMERQIQHLNDDNLCGNFSCTWQIQGARAHPICCMRKLMLSWVDKSGWKFHFRKIKEKLKMRCCERMWLRGTCSAASSHPPLRHPTKRPGTVNGMEGDLCDTKIVSFKQHRGKRPFFFFFYLGS